MFFIFLTGTICIIGRAFFNWSVLGFGIPLLLVIPIEIVFTLIHLKMVEKYSVTEAQTYELARIGKDAYHSDVDDLNISFATKDESVNSGYKTHIYGKEYVSMFPASEATATIYKAKPIYPKWWNPIQNFFQIFILDLPEGRVELRFPFD